MEKPNCVKCRIGMELIHHEKSWNGQYTLKFECWNCHSTTEIKPDDVSEEELGRMIMNEKTEEEKFQEKLLFGKNLLHQRIMAEQKGELPEQTLSNESASKFSEEEELYIKKDDISKEEYQFLDRLGQLKEKKKEFEPKMNSEKMIMGWMNHENDFECILKLAEEMKSENTLQFIEKYVVQGQEQAMKFSNFETMMRPKLDKPNFVFGDKPYDKLALLGTVVKMIVAKLKIEEFRKSLPTPVSFDKLIEIAAEHIDVTHKFELFFNNFFN